MGAKTGTPDILHKISAESIHPKYYFQSLVEQAVSCGLLTDRDISAMQMDDRKSCLRKKCSRWNRCQAQCD